ncbi:HDOD domain-containing protein [uncultured Desulfosarcina sp.]|uniref:EAL and HDOD domain-containing protein n=1 Tax=uncultured Desulfosarcina sp. TaxID=218289 RepID=UPI0029C725D3|nr:HDOD domain-containing protein [uncultured Desulfosarcina sp.]
MKNVYVARQPIFDRNKSIYAYELLFRDGAANCIPEIDGDVATKALLTNSFFSFGMDTLVGGRRFFINFTQNLLEKKVPLLLPKERVVVEILEDVTPTPVLIDACSEIAAKGYVIALDDFVYSTELDPLIALADIIKFDFRLTPKKTIDSCLKQLPEANRTLLAEKVESYDEFEAALEMGFELFQGYFFCRPEVIQRAEIQGSQLHLMAIMAQLANDSFQLEEMEKLISRDISISYKLFKYLNSAFFGRACKVSSVREALVYLGEKEFRRFVALIAMSRLAEGKPNELIRAACIRGKFCELLGADLKVNASPSEMFTLGMFSLIDAVIDRPMNRIMAELPLSGAIKTALVDARGPLIGVIELVRRYESGQWDKVSRLSRALKIEDETLPALYFQACQWSNAASKASS